MLTLLLILPVIFGLIVPFLRLKSRNARLCVIIGAQAAYTVLSFIVLLSKSRSETLFNLTDKISVGLENDSVAVLFCLMTAVGWLLTFVFSVRYEKHDTEEGRFYSFLFLTQAAMFGASLSSNLVSMYFFFECVTFLSMPLVLQSRTKESVAAAKKYLFYSIAGAFAALFGIFTLNVYAGTLEFTAGGSCGELPGIGMAAVFVMVVGFGAKAGLFPLHGWLPTAHPAAPAPASALLSGLIAKAGVLAIIRTVFFVVGTDALRGSWVQKAWLVLALLTVFMGSMMAYYEKVLKKRLAYSTVSQISYVLCGIFVLSEPGALGALLQVLFHADAKMALFMCAGVIICLTSKTKVDELSGIGKKLPITMVCFFITSLSLIGIPPTGGFISKWYLAASSLSDSGLGAFAWIIPVVLLVSALLTAGYLLPVAVHAFFPDKSASLPSDDGEKISEPAVMYVPLIILSVLALLGGILPSLFTGVLSSVASSMFPV